MNPQKQNQQKQRSNCIWKASQEIQPILNERALHKDANDPGTMEYHHGGCLLWGSREQE